MNVTIPHEILIYLECALLEAIGEKKSLQRLDALSTETKNSLQEDIDKYREILNLIKEKNLEYLKK